MRIAAPISLLAVSLLVLASILPAAPSVAVTGKTLSSLAAATSVSHNLALSTLVSAQSQAVKGTLALAQQALQPFAGNAPEDHPDQAVTPTHERTVTPGESVHIVNTIESRAVSIQITIDVVVGQGATVDVSKTVHPPNGDISIPIPPSPPQ